MSTDAPHEPKPVKFRFEHIGPVAEAELELGDLTIVAGRNNTGKTYLVYTLYGFLKTWINWPGPAPSVPEQTEARSGAAERYSIFEKLIGSIREGGEARIAVERRMLGQERSKIMESLTRSFSKDVLAGVFSAHPDTFTDASFQVVLDNEGPDDSSIRVIPHGNDVLPGELSLEYDGEYITVTGLLPQTARARSSEVRRNLLWRSYRFGLFPELAQIDPFVLSAERFGISLFYKELDFTKNRLVDLLQKMGDRNGRDLHLPFALMDEAASRYALPIKHNIDYTRDIPDLVKRKGEFHEERLFKSLQPCL